MSDGPRIEGRISLADYHDAMSEVGRLRADRDRLRELLQELIDIEGPQPGTAGWAAKVYAALAASKACSRNNADIAAAEGGE